MKWHVDIVVRNLAGEEVHRQRIQWDTERERNIETQRWLHLIESAKLQGVLTIETGQECEHRWEEQAGEPPVDVCISCGEVMA